MVNRKNDPNYQQVSAYIRKELVIEFKQFLAVSDLNISEGLEEALALYLAQKKSGS